MVKQRLFKVFLICFLFYGIGSSQTNEKVKTPLIKVLEVLESKFQISFSYAHEMVEEVLVTPPKATLDLQESLAFLSTETKLTFTVLNPSFVVIASKEKEQAGFELQELNEVVVSNYLTSGISRTNNGETTIKPHKFGILPGMTEPDLLQSIQALPGIMSVDETISNINIRGGTHDQNLILWDGIKMYQSGHFFGLISAFSPYLTEHVDVSKSGTSAQYGDGVSSVIDMQNSNNISQEFKAGLGINLINLDGFLKLPISKNIEFQLSTRRAITDFVNTPTYKSYFDRVFQDTDITNNGRDLNGTISKDETFYFSDLSTKLLANLTEKDRLRFNFMVVSNHIQYKEQSTINGQDSEFNSYLNQNSLNGGMSYERLWNSKLNTNLQVYVSNYKLDAANQDILNDQRLIQENKVKESALKLHSNWFINDQFKLTSGYQFFETGVSNLEEVDNPFFKSYIKEVLRTHSIYFELQYLCDNLNTNIKFGGRLNYFDKFDTYTIEPRVSFSQRFWNYFRFELLGEVKSQTTSQVIDLQNDFLGIEKRRWVLANNQEVPIIKSKQGSAGLHFDKANFLISIEGYLKQVEGITSRSQGFQNQFQYAKDTGNYEVLGLDFLINKQFKNTSTWLSYTYSNNTYTFNTLNNGEAFPNNLDITHALTFGATQTLKSLNLALGVNWHSGKPYTQPNADTPIENNTINYAAPNSSNLEDYFRVDLSATYRFKLSDTAKAIAGVSLWNLTNKENIINSYYKLKNDEVIQIDNTSLGLTPNASLRVNF